jgi:hypothetical protein
MSETMQDTTATAEPPLGLVGNRWALVGALVYLSEFVAIIAVGAVGVGEVVLRGTSAGALQDSYGGHEDATAFLAGWLAVVLLGRVLYFAAVRRSLADSGRGHVLLDLAVVAAAVSVTLEVASYAFVVPAAHAAEEGEETLLAYFDLAGAGLNLMIGGGLGVAIVCTAVVMVTSGLFNRWLNVLGLVSGIAIVGAQLAVPPSLSTVFDILYFFPLVFWVWMLWTSVVLWRRA